MVAIGAGFIKTSLIYCAVIVTILILGCIDKTDEKPVDVVSVQTPTSQIKEDLSAYNSSEGTFTHIFKVNDEDAIFNINIQFLGYSKEGSIVLLMVDKYPYQIPYNTEKMIKDYVIKVTDIDDTSQSVKIIVKQIK